MGDVLRVAEHGLDCESPLLVALPDGGRTVWLCSNHRASKCRPCAARYRRRVQAVAHEGVSRLRAEGVLRYFLTLTAPSESQHCMRPGCEAAPYCRHEKCPCTPAEGVDLAVWNAQAGKAWNRFLLYVEKEYGVRPQFFRAAEPQDGKRREDGIGRGALHHHVLVVVPAVLEEKKLRQLAIRAGYGHVLDLQLVDSGSKALAQYVTKRVAGYVAKGADGRSDVAWRQEVVDLETGELTERTDATYRTWSQSQNFGPSMASIRRQAQVKALEILRGQQLEVSQQRPATEEPPTAGARASDETSPSP